MAARRARAAASDAAHRRANAAAADDPEGQARLGAFLQGLQQSGLERSAATCASRPAGARPIPTVFRRHAAELVALAPDVISGPAASACRPLLQATRTMPIVFPLASDPVGAGFVDSLARPGGNAPGFACPNTA